MDERKQLTVTISLDKYAELMKDAYFLSLLEQTGVDNWCGYGEWRNIMGDEAEDPDDYKERIIKEYIENENKKGEQE